MATSKPYTPAREDPASLLRRTVGRDVLLTSLQENLRSAATTRNRPHTLLIGPRGAGKSHVVNVVLDQLQKDTEIRGRFAVVSVPEDAIGYTRFDDLLDHVVRELGTFDEPRHKSTVERAARIAELTEGKVLLITLENLNRFMERIGPGGQRNFRSWVEQSRDVMLIGTTPLLFPAVQDRDLPWYGSFTNTAVPDLTPAEGHELLVRLAKERGDEALEAFLNSDVGLARVNALAALTGGSPRIWMILSECLNPANLDELIPAVQDLLEGLVPYYQQLLLELPPNEARVVRALADGERAALTVSEIADFADLGQATTSVTLQRLVKDRWVQSAKLPAGDRRKTWYQLREPLLRHHFQYRSGDRGPLALIVTILKVFFDQDSRSRLLAEAPPDSQALHHLAETFRGEPRRSDLGYNARDVDALKTEARLWMRESTEDPWNLAEAGQLIESAITTLHASTAPDPEPDLATAVGSFLAELIRDQSLDDWTNQWMAFLEACWNGQADSDHARTRDRLHEILQLIHPLNPRRLIVNEEWADWTGKAGDATTARARFADLLRDRELALGPSHPDTLDTRYWFAYWTRESRDPAQARDIYATLIRDSASTCDPSSPLALTYRINHAFTTGEAGDPTAARDLMVGIVEDSKERLSPDHPDGLDERFWLAYWTGRNGEIPSALELSCQLLLDLGIETPPQTRWAVVNLAVTHARMALAADSADATGLVQLLINARDGSAEALVQLPSELRQVVDVLGRQKAVLEHHSADSD